MPTAAEGRGACEPKPQKKIPASKLGTSHGGQAAWEAKHVPECMHAHALQASVCLRSLNLAP